jgi:uncharacterized protein (TIGR03083 family)
VDRDELWQTIDDERRTLADLLDDLSPAEWETPSLCAGWRVRDVAAHLTLSHASALSAVGWMIRARGSFNRMVRDSAVRQARLPVERYGELLRGMVGSRRTAPMVSDLEPLLDVIVHGQDIAVPLGRHRAVPPRAAAVCASRVWSMGWPFHARRRLRGLRFVATDESWTVGEGTPVQGPISAILLLLTGRPAALPDLSGPGRTELDARLPLGRA